MVGDVTDLEETEIDTSEVELKIKGRPEEHKLANKGQRRKLQRKVRYGKQLLGLSSPQIRQAIHQAKQGLGLKGAQNVQIDTQGIHYGEEKGIND